MMLDRNVGEMMSLCTNCRFNFDQSPSLISTALKYIHSDENAPVLERPLEDRRDFWVCN
jgi:hypothetical protein